MQAGQHLYLIDGSGYIFRAFFGLPMMNRPDGTPVNAVFGFSSMMMNLLEGNEADYLTVVFDAARKNFRNDIYPDYKGHRPDTPEELVPQFQLIRDAVAAFNLPCMELEGYEADDLIATYAKKAAEAGLKVTIVSSDKDLMQLINDQVALWDPVKNKIIDRAGCIEKFGVPPEKVVDVQALAGDNADNVPGVPGIGIKTAAQLINEYGDLENLLANASQIKQPKRRQSLIDFADQARISKQLVQLALDAPEPFTIEALARQPLNREQILDFFNEQGFRHLIKRLGDKGRDPAFQAKSTDASVETEAPIESPIIGLDMAYEHYQIIQKEEDLHIFLAHVKAARVLAIDTETTGLHVLNDDLVGISLAYAPQKSCYIPLRHQNPQADNLFADVSADQIIQLPIERVRTILQPFLSNPAILKIGHNLKFDLSILDKAGFQLSPIDDTMLISFALEAGLSGHSMDKLSKRHLNHQPVSFSDIAGKGAKQLRFDQIPLQEAAHYAAEDADVTLRLWLKLKPRLLKTKLSCFYETIERPLIPVLANMERLGIKIDVPRLQELDAEFKIRMIALEQEIYELAGEVFNIASPKQMGDILFGKLGLPASNKTGAGALSTNVAVLEPLAETYPIAAKILDWRMLAKLHSTYCDALIKAANPQNGRVHTAFSMVGAQTGRLSSSDPNLQNIPVRTAEGRMIRSAFIAQKGYKLISMDYSQIELRLLAEMADIKSLKQAFLDGLDIHAATASEVFSMPLNEVTGEWRRKAKAINFGIVYGISAFGLAKQISVSNGEAKAFIDSYFQKFPGIRAYMNDMVHHCELTGYVETLFGRRIYIPSIKDSNRARAKGAGRQAINAPIQGSAADVIKLAMNRIPYALKQQGFDDQQEVRMLLQVHDELLFEIKEDLLDRAVPLLKQIMEDAATPLRKLEVPLLVDTGIADNWRDAH